jgi:glycolate oxidase iron-sulfur subunit
MDNPRGRLTLMRALNDGRLSVSKPLVRHLDLCLDCRACESACPSGVPYRRELEATRTRLHGTRRRPLKQRLVERAVLAGVSLPPRAQAALVGMGRAARRIGLLGLLARRKGPLGTAAQLLAAQPEPVPEPASEPTRANGRRVGLLAGCVARWLFGGVHAATVRLLDRAGCAVVVPAGQRCCGALHLHAGDRAGASRLARANIEAFERAGPLEAIVVNAAGCGSAMKDYPELFAGDPFWEPRARRFAGAVRDALTLLDEIGLPEPRRPLPADVAYHDACHLAHAQGVREAPRSLLSAIPELRLVPLAEADRCCGSAGLYNLLHPHEGRAILQEKLAAVRDSGAGLVAAANPGCLLHIAAGARAAGLPLRAVHPLELLDEACR